MDTTITKRLHISGLTAAIAPDVLSQRLSTFGTVTSLDGLGLCDALGQPRNFAYATLETTPAKLSRCLNLLNGATWKGTKLRIGEAKPDFTVRLAKEREENFEPSKKIKKFGARHAADMSLVTRENAAGRPGWTVTPLGRVLHSVRMRPARPLPPVHAENKVNARDTERKRKKKRAREPDTRARRRTIDMTRWGSVHLKGIFLDMAMPEGSKSAVEPFPDITSQESSDGEDEREEDDINVPEAADVLDLEERCIPSTNPRLEATKVDSNTSLASAPSIELPHDDILEKTRSLQLLTTLFNGDNDSNWIGKESPGSEVDPKDLAQRNEAISGDFDMDFELVPQDKEMASPIKSFEVENDNMHRQEGTVALVNSNTHTQPMKLKDLFAPREETTTGFSLLDNLDLDLDMDDVLPFVTEALQPQSTSLALEVPILSNSATLTARPITLDRRNALFFPLCLTTSDPLKARTKDVFDLMRDNGWSWRDLRGGFFHTDGEEAIRAQWEEARGELTREWKRRCREAGKISRRRGGRGDGDME